MASGADDCFVGHPSHRGAPFDRGLRWADTTPHKEGSRQGWAVAFTLECPEVHAEAGSSAPAKRAPLVVVARWPSRWSSRARGRTVSPHPRVHERRREPTLRVNDSRRERQAVQDPAKGLCPEGSRCLSPTTTRSRRFWIGCRAGDVSPARTLFFALIEARTVNGDSGLRALSGLVGFSPKLAPH